MKKALILIMVLVMAVGIVGCSSAPAEETVTLSLGETFETDIVRFTLNNSAFAIALHDGTAGDWEHVGLPKEYDPERDRNNYNVAATGHTIVSYSVTVENLDRVPLDFGDENDETFLTIIYNSQSYPGLMHTSYVSRDGFDWNSNMMNSISIDPQEKLQFRISVDIPVEVADFTDPVDMTFAIPTSSGTPAIVTYSVTNADRTVYAEQEISVEDALMHFTSDEGYEYFTNHMDEYSAISIDEIKALTTGEWNMRLQGSNFAFENDIVFDDGFYTYYYKTTRVDIPFSVEDNALLINMAEETHVCEVRTVNDTAYLLVCENAPFGVLFK